MEADRPLIVVAPDSFKGSCGSPAAAAALARGARAALGDAVRVREVPMADGGEGTLDALIAAWGGSVLTVCTSDALGRERSARVGLSPDGSTAIIEAAEANGLPLVADRPLRPLDADSFGVGLLVRAALDAGARELLLCVGGSATSDGGAGMLRALGARLLDRNGADIAPGARGLAQLERIDTEQIDARARAAVWRIAADVDTPLVGPRGAAAVFGPQKGARPTEVGEIDAGLRRLASLLAHLTGADAAELGARPGTGAAGGLPAGPVALFDAEVAPGSELVARAAGLDEALTGASLVLAGEGRLDAQSLRGKVLTRVLQGAPAGVPVVAIAGSVELGVAECRNAGLTAALSIAQGPATLDELMERAPELLAEAAAQACALVFSPPPP